MEELEMQISDVRQYRTLKAAIDEKVTESKRKWSEENDELLFQQKNATDALLHEEAKLRELTLASYALDGNKKPAPGGGIRITKCVEYDPKFALVWAKNQGVAIKLDATAFEKAVLAFSEADRENLGLDEICKVWEKPQATISEEL